MSHRSKKSKSPYHFNTIDTIVNKHYAKSFVAVVEAMGQHRKFQLTDLKVIWKRFQEMLPDGEDYPDAKAFFERYHNVALPALLDGIFPLDLTDGRAE